MTDKQQHHIWVQFTVDTPTDDEALAIVESGVDDLLYEWDQIESASLGKVVSTRRLLD